MLSYLNYIFLFKVGYKLKKLTFGWLLNILIPRKYIELLASKNVLKIEK